MAVRALRFPCLQPLPYAIFARELRAVGAHPGVAGPAAADYARQYLDGTNIGPCLMLNAVLVDGWLGVDAAEM